MIHPEWSETFLNTSNLWATCQVYADWLEERFNNEVPELPSFLRGQIPCLPEQFDRLIKKWFSKLFNVYFEGGEIFNLYYMGCIPYKLTIDQDTFRQNTKGILAQTTVATITIFGRHSPVRSSLNIPGFKRLSRVASVHPSLDDRLVMFKRIKKDIVDELFEEANR